MTISKPARRRQTLPTGVTVPWTAALAALFFMACASHPAPPTTPPTAQALHPGAGGNAVNIAQHISGDRLTDRIAEFARVDIGLDRSVLTAPEIAALEQLVLAAGVMDEIFLRQVWAGNPALRATLERIAAERGDPVSRDLLHFFRINFGPWDRLAADAPFIGTAIKPKGAGYYPEDLTETDFNAFVSAHPSEATALKDFFTCVRRDGDGLSAVPYSREYGALLERGARHLETAARLLTAPANHQQLPEGVDYTTLAAFLRSRAAAFRENDYFQSDMDWMDVRDNIVDVTIGPYEVYEDALFGYKAAFEAFIAVRNPADSRKLADLKNYLPDMERGLPIPDEFKNMDRGTESPISVVDVIFAGGDTKAGVQTIAFNLPNDERVREAKGSKKVMLKNIARAKFDKILVPIARVVVDPTQVEMVNFDSYFSNVLMHELSHGLGPGTITLADGTETTVNQALKTLYPPLEEAKADIMGLYQTAFLVDKGYFPAGAAQKAYVSFLPGFFRAIRFGASSAHGRANMMEFNYMKEKGAIVLDSASGRFHVDLEKMPDAVRSMTSDLCMIQAHGDYAGAEAFLARYGDMPATVEAQLKRLDSIPTDIEPVYAAQAFLRP